MADQCWGAKEHCCASDLWSGLAWRTMVIWCFIIILLRVCVCVCQNVFRGITWRTPPRGILHDPHAQTHSNSCRPHIGQFTAASVTEYKWCVYECMCVCVCPVPSERPPALCRRHLHSAELHEFLALAVHRCGCPGFNLPAIHQARPAPPL